MQAFAQEEEEGKEEEEQIVCVVICVDSVLHLVATPEDYDKLKSD